MCSVDIDFLAFFTFCMERHENYKSDDLERTVLKHQRQYGNQLGHQRAAALDDVFDSFQQLQIGVVLPSSRTASCFTTLKQGRLLERSCDENRGNYDLLRRHSARLKILSSRMERRFSPYPSYKRLDILTKLCPTNDTKNDVLSKLHYDLTVLGPLSGALDEADFANFSVLPFCPLKVPHLQPGFLQSSCSSQARLGCDERSDQMPVNELAAYLDEFLYLPKTMSFMAENMYT